MRRRRRSSGIDRSAFCDATVEASDGPYLQAREMHWVEPPHPLHLNRVDPTQLFEALEVRGCVWL